MFDVVISEFMGEAAVADIVRLAPTLYDPALVERPDDLATAVADARVLVVRNRTQVRGDLLAAARRLELVGRLGVGLDNIDIEACRARGIAVRPATGANDRSVAEYVVTTALMLLRGAYLASSLVAAGQWPRERLIGREAAGKMLGLVGIGRIARETARLARALGFSVIGYDPHLSANDAIWPLIPRRAELNDLLADADVVSLHVPLTDSTRSLFDARTIARMRRGAILINAARGGIVDEAAVITALTSGHLSGAVLDVFAEEPLDTAAATIFRDCPNLVLTPHIAGVTVEANERVCRMIAKKVADYLKDRLRGAL